MGAQGKTGGGWSPTVNSVDRVKPPRFDGSMSWAMFYHHFEAMVGHNSWASQKVTHLLTIQQGQTFNVLQSIPTEVTYGEIFEVLQSYFGDRLLAMAHHSQLKARIKLSSEYLPPSSWPTGPLSGCCSTSCRGRDRGLRGEVPPHRWLEDSWWGSWPGPEVRGCKSSSQVASKGVSCKGWSAQGTVVTRDWA
jgi:hypothetical protein